MAIFIPGTIHIPDRGLIITKSGIPQVETTNFGTYHMADRPDLYEPMRTNNFEFLVVGLNEAIERNRNPYNVETDGPLNAEEVIRVSIDGAFLPHFTLNPIAVKRGNSTLYYAGAPSFQQSQLIKLKDYIGLNAKMALMAWLDLSYNVRTEKVGLASNYKLDCHVKEYTPDYILIRSWHLYGCWISGISESGYDAASLDNLNQITATISYDRAVPELD